MVGEQLGMLKSEIRARGIHLGVGSMSVGFKAVRCSHQGSGYNGRKERSPVNRRVQGRLPEGGEKEARGDGLSKRGRHPSSDGLGQICSSVE